MRLRARTPDDDLVPLLLRVHAHDGYPLRATPEVAVAFLESGTRLGAWVAERDDVVVGHVALLGDPEYATLRHAAEVTGLRDLALVARLFVDPAAQRGGVGRALLQHAVEQARALELRAVLDVGQVFEGAVALYEAEGWLRLGAYRHDVGEDVWVYLSPTS